MGIGETSRGKEVLQASGSSASELNHHHHQQQVTANSASFHISRPSFPIPTIISPPPPSHLHTSIILDDVTRLMLQNDNHFQVILINHH